MIHLRANTAVDVLIGPFVDDSDGNTVETGLTIAQADVRLSKNGQNMAQKSDATACSHDELGYYNCELDATDTNTEGSLVLCVHESGALPVRHEYCILAEAAWDSLYAAKDDGYMDVNIKAISEDTTAADTLETFVEITNLTSLTIDASGHLEVDVVEIEGADPTDTIRDAVVDDATRLDASSLNAIEAKVDTVDGIVDAILVDTGTTLDGKIDTVDGIVDAILVDTSEIGAAGAGLTAVPWNAAWDAEVQSECDDALVAQKLDHLVAVADADDAVNDSIVAKLAASDGDWSGYDNSSDSLEAIRDRGDADWSSGSAANPNLLLEAEIDVVNSQTEFTLASGSDIENSYNDQAIVLYDDSNSDYPSIRTITDYAGGTKTVTIDTAPDFTLGADDSVKIFVTAPGSTAPTAAQVADAVWDESLSGHTNAGSSGKAISDIETDAGKIDTVDTVVDAILVDTAEIQGKLPTNYIMGSSVQSDQDDDIAAILDDTNSTLPALIAGLNDPSAADIADAIWDEPTTGHTSTGTFGEQLKTDVDAILTDTAEIGAAGAGLTAIPWNASWDAEVQSECTDALNAYDPPTKAELDTAVADVSVDEIQVSALADLFNTDSGTNYASAAAGSVVKEIVDNAGGSALTEAGIADAVWDEAIAGHQSAGSTGKNLYDAATGVAAGTGSETKVYTVYEDDDVTPLENVDVWVTTDAGGTNVVASGTTNGSGQVTFYLDPGTYYVWSQKDGWNFNNPDTEVVS